MSKETNFRIVDGKLVEDEEASEVEFEDNLTFEDE